jgi:hypothetical protein
MRDDFALGECQSEGAEVCGFSVTLLFYPRGRKDEEFCTLVATGVNALDGGSVRLSIGEESSEWLPVDEAQFHVKWNDDSFRGMLILGCEVRFPNLSPSVQAIDTYYKPRKRNDEEERLDGEESEAD